MAKSPNVTGPYTGYVHNPVLTNANTSEYCELILRTASYRTQRSLPHDRSANSGTCRSVHRYSWKLVGGRVGHQKRDSKLVRVDVLLPTRIVDIC